MIRLRAIQEKGQARILYNIFIRAIQFIKPLDLSSKRSTPAKTSIVTRFHATNT
jgi:hypothetical protein